MSKIEDRIKTIKNNIAQACARTGRDPGNVKIVVVTKAASIEAVKEVVTLGYTELGENRIQHLEPIAEEIENFLRNAEPEQNLPKKITWHMIGHLQRNKVQKTLKISSVIHSVDTLRLAEEIDKAATKMNIKPQVMLQINCSQEPQKYGVPVGAAIHMADQIMTMPNLKLIGLMTMAPLTLKKDIVGTCFRRAREIFEEIKSTGIVGPDFTELSMGMSQDYEIAVENGATILRIGSAIFA